MLYFLSENEVKVIENLREKEQREKVDKVKRDEAYKRLDEVLTDFENAGGTIVGIGNIGGEETLCEITYWENTKKIVLYFE